ncbi:MAG: bifunctional glutamate N-acetyltransferase/amino-acid acetyltransferase ArgJ [Brevinematales bacterium]|nr:bifunctional glutamate N-acetyltransferase/amino-acid acetyltransferase ArgJ [Brevinematales bacterium]
MENYVGFIEGGGISSVRGFRVNGIASGLKELSFKDLGLIYSESPCEVSALFTKNKVKAAHIVVDGERLNNKISAIVVNSGNANCLTGEMGIKNALEMTALVEKNFGLSQGSVLVASTGVIGKQLNMDVVRYGIEKLCRVIKVESDEKNFSHAIMTTDRKIKTSACEFEIGGKLIRIGGAVKGAGMIKPDMDMLPHATMLAFIVTDANIDKKALNEALIEATNQSFNRISVDNDTSTNDSVFLLSNGLAENKEIKYKSEEYEKFVSYLTKMCQHLAKMIVRDGEGATKVVKVEVKNALTEIDAYKITRAIADSYLVKTAIFGQSPNWGRILAAVGYSGGKFELDKIKLYFNDLLIFENGKVIHENESRAGSEMISNEMTITVDLDLGRKDYFVWTSDLTCDYVKINANYLS